MSWDWILALLGMFGLYLTTKKMVAGFVVGASLQVLWLTYALSTSQYGFVLSAVGFGFVNLLGIYRWTRPKKTVDKSQAIDLYFHGIHDLHCWMLRMPNGTFAHESKHFDNEKEMLQDCLVTIGRDILDEERYTIKTTYAIKSRSDLIKNLRKEYLRTFA